LDDHPSLHLWLIFIGGIFAPAGSTRLNFVNLLNQKYAFKFGQQLYQSWPEIHEILNEFVWSEKAFAPQVKAFWTENFM
jgi:hypothetical protein